MKKMADWLKGLKLTLGIVVAVYLVGVTTGASLDGWLALPSTVAVMATRQTADSLNIAQNRRAVAALRTVTTSLTSGQRELLELVRTIDRRTCITAADNETDLAACANR